MLIDVTESLAAITAPGSFCTRATASPEHLDLEVKGVGPVTWPVSAETARKLRDVARPAKYGWRAKTFVDPQVRNTWAIARSRIKIDKRKWKKTMAPQLELIRDQLGLPDGGELEARLYKMLLYEAGQFFVPHQDSERSDDMVGTLIVALPSAYSGGSTHIEHRGQKVMYRPLKSRAEQLTFVAFYADCHHEVRPIKEGYRIVLVYDLISKQPALGSASSLDEESLDKLALNLDTYFTTPVPARYSRQRAAPPDKLVYLLDHEYTRKSLGWNRLKNGDRSRALALRDAAHRLDCKIFLAQADVHEIWSCEGDDYYDGWGYRGYSGRRYRDADNDPESYQLHDLVDSDIELRHWLDSTGKTIRAVNSPVSDAEVCYTKPSVECDPFRSEHEGWMGNTGNTVERWYHRAAVVLWPRERTFVIRAKISPVWAIRQLSRLIDKGARAEAREKANALLPFWVACAGRDSSEQFFEGTLKVADALQDAKLATSLLEPFRLDRLTPDGLSYLVNLLGSHGQTWCWQLFIIWVRYFERFSGDGEVKWLHFMPTFCQTLRNEGARPGRALAFQVIAYQWSLIKARCEQGLADVTYPPAIEQLSALSRRLAPVLQSCVALDNREVHESIVSFLTAEDTRYPVRSLVALLRGNLDGHTAGERIDALRLGTIYQHCIDQLQLILAAPGRAQDDWSMIPPAGCSCKLCVCLGEFLSHRDRVRFEWPLAKDKRRHIHGVLDRYKLPVTHTTRRTGSPHKLVLEKTAALFTREQDLRSSYERELAWLQSLRGQ